jgi:broad specificity phosphatase PhoE
MDRLILAGHAESQYNANSSSVRIPSSGRSPLTQRGTRQAQQLADRLAAEHVDVSGTSGTLRAVQTSEIVASARSIPVVKTPLLDDRQPESSKTALSRRSSSG